MCDSNCFYVIKCDSSNCFSFPSADGSNRQNQLSARGTGASTAGEWVHPAVQPEKGGGDERCSGNNIEHKEENIYFNCVFWVWFWQAALQDSQVELETYKQTRQGLDEMYNVVWKQYKEEKRIRQVQYQQALVCMLVMCRSWYIFLNTCICAWCVPDRETESDKKWGGVEGKVLHTVFQTNSIKCQSLTHPACTCDIFWWS